MIFKLYGALEALHLSGEALDRLLEVADLAADSSQTPGVLPEVWRELDSILLQARKRRDLYAAWRQQEVHLDLRIDPEVFWPPEREPIEGMWPPAIDPSLPLIDPEHLDGKQLPEPTAGTLARAIYASRQMQGATLEQALKQAHGSMTGDTATQMDALLRQALGDPVPGDPLPQGLDVAVLLQDLTSLDSAVVAAAEAAVRQALWMSVESFKRLMEVRALPNPAAEAWTEVYTILADAEKRKRRYPQWVAEEQSAGLRDQVWLALKAPLPKWRAGYPARAAWRRALQTRSDRPVIDPDLIGPGELQQPDIGQAAFDLWNERRENFVVAGLAALEQERESHSDVLAGFDAIVLNSLFDPANDLPRLQALAQTGREAFGLATLLTMVWGSSHPDLDALSAALQSSSEAVQATARRTVIETLCMTPDEFAFVMQLRAQNASAVSAAQWQQLYALLAHAALLCRVMGLADVRARGEDIHPRLGQIGLPLDGFTRLHRLRGLLAGNANLLDEEWDDVYAILLQARKRRQFGAWRAEEQAASIYLSPSIFKLPAKLPLAVPPLEPVPLPTWRATRRERNDWLDQVESRIDQDAAVGQALKEAVSDTEAAALPALRDALILAATSANLRGDIAAKAKWLGDRLLIDTRNDGCATTTRIAQAIETLQGLLWSLRNRLLNDTYPDLDLDDDDFDESWEWLGSYQTWRTAVFVFLYPENILAPQLRRHQTPAFRELVSDLRDNRRLTPGIALDYARRYADYFVDIADLEPQASCQTRVRVYENGAAVHGAYKLFVFALGGKTGKPYWCAYDPDDESDYAQSFWTEIPGFGRIVKLVGAAPYQQASDTRHIYLFAITEETGQKKLNFARFDLELNAWEGEATELELLDDSGRFDALVTQRYRERITPEIVLQRKDGAIFIRSLGADGTDWEDEEWRLMLGYAKGRDLTLRAYIEIDKENSCLIVSESDARLFCRIYGERDDGQWKQISSGSFLGTIGSPERIVVFCKLAGGKEIIHQISLSLGGDFTNLSVKTGEDLDKWLLDAAGASLKRTRFPDGHAFHVSGGDIPLGGVALWNTLRMEVDLYSSLSAAAEMLLKAAESAAGKLFLEEQVRQHSIDWLWSKLQQQSGVTTHKDYGPWVKVDTYIKKMATSIPEEHALWSALKYIFREPTTLTFRQRPSEVFAIGWAPAGMSRLAPSSGWIPKEVKRIFVMQRAGSHEGVFRCRFISNKHQQLAAISVGPLAPLSIPTFSYSPDLSEAALEKRRQDCASAFASNSKVTASIRTYLEEAFYHLPMIIAASLSARGHYTSALDWYRTVYDYSQSPAKRVIYTPLDARTRAPGFDRPDDWLLDPLDPHAMNRNGKDKRYTLLSVCGCILDYADAEFTRDTAESVPRARLLYETALELLDLPELKQHINRCADIIGALNIEVGDPYWVPAVKGLKKELATLGSAALVEQTAAQMTAALVVSNAAWATRIANARAVMANARAKQSVQPDVAAVLGEGARLAATAALVLESDPDVAQLSARAGGVATRSLRNALSLVTGINTEALERDTIELPALRKKHRADAEIPGDATPGLAIDPGNRRSDHAELSRYNPLAPTRTAQLIKFTQADPIRAVKLINQRRGGGSFVPAPSFSFCIPPNPVLKWQRLRAELNLYKIHTCRNIAGMRRELEPYAAPTDTVSGLPTIGAGGQLILPGLDVLKPTPYRYPVLIERARQLVGLAQQIEAAMLASIEKGDAERYSVLKARQDVQMAAGGVRLQSLRVREAQGGVKLAELQQERAQIQRDTYQAWLDASGSLWESLQIGYLVASVAQYSFAAYQAITSPFRPDFAAAAKSTADAAQVLGQIQGIYAARERQEKDWELQKNLADQDIRIGAQQVKMAEDHVRVTEQERVIAELQLDHSRDVVEFLVNKFTNVELYDWMSDVLEGVYSYFLQQATSTAQLAASQLAFERQESSPPIIQTDYWEAPADYFGAGEDGKAPDRRGLTGSARLLQDIQRLDQYAFDTDQRKLQLTKTLSLAQLAPAEFQRFRETGVMLFATPMALFDRDFPGHYLRLVKRVRTSVIALIPPVQGIHAALSSTGMSRVVVGGDIFQTVVVNHGPQSVALTSPVNATGLFELDTQPEMLLPFEGLGVDTTWELRLPKPANRFDFSTIADVLVTIEYTALNSYDYRYQVIQDLGDRFSADRPFSFRHQFADQWYDLHHPAQTATPMVVRFRTQRADFPPNLENLKIDHVVLYFARADGAAFEVPVTALRFKTADTNAEVGGAATSIDGIISTRKGNAASWTAMLGSTPFGDWVLALPNTLDIKDRLSQGEIDDILLVITYSARTPAWPI